MPVKKPNQHPRSSESDQPNKTIEQTMKETMCGSDEPRDESAAAKGGANKHYPLDTCPSDALQSHADGGETVVDSPEQSANPGADGSDPPGTEKNAASVAPTTEHGGSQQVGNQCEDSVAAGNDPRKLESDPNEMPAPMALETPAGHVDLDQLAVGQSFAELSGVVTEAMSVGLRKPGRQEWFSPYPETALWRRYAVLKDDSDGEFYIVPPDLFPRLETECALKILVPCVSKTGAWFVWPIGVQGPDGKINSWNESAQRAVRKYAGKWIRITANRGANGYDVATSVSYTESPEWPSDITPIIRKAVGGKVIESLDHPVVKRLRGEN